MMNDFMRELLTVSLTTSAVTLLLLILTPLLSKRYAAKWRYLAWLIVAVRLLIPLTPSLPAAPVNIPVPETVIAETTLPVSLPQDEFSPLTPQVDGSAQREQADIQNAPEKPAPISLSVLLLGVWGLGMVVFFTVQAAVYFRFRRRIKHSPQGELSAYSRNAYLEIGTDMGMTRLPEIRVCGVVPAPILTGLLRPVLFLPHERYTRQELTFILRHELVHYRRRDLWYKLALTVANGIHWFNPLVYLMNAQAGKDVELSCDDQVMAGLGGEERATYGEAILNALPIKTKWRLEPVFTTSFGSTKASMKQRLKNLFDNSVKKRGIAALCAVVLLVGMIGGVIVFTPMAVAAENTKEMSFSIDNIADGEAVCIGRIELKSSVDYNLSVSAQSGTQWAVGLNKSGDITASDASGIAWKQYYGSAGRRQIEALFSDHQNGSYYVYVMSTGSKLTGVSGTLSTDNPSGSIVRKEATIAGGTMKTVTIGDDTWYLVETEAQLRSIAASEESLSRNYMQNDDITVTSVWTPIGTEEKPFTGIYNGNGFAVRGLRYRETEQRRGLFGYADYAYLQNITIVGVGTGPVAAINLDGELTDCAVISEEEYQAIVKARQTAAQTVSFVNVELRYYDSNSPYIHDIISNNTSKRMMTNEICMLAFDKDGKPLKLRWNYWNSSSTPEYSFLYGWGSDEIAPGANNDNADNNGGWSLFGSADYIPAEVGQVAYILYNFKQITFADGTVWENPGYDSWLNTYEGKTVDVEILEGYYPFSVAVE